MAHPGHNQGFFSPGVFRLVLFLASVLLVGYILGPVLHWHLTGKIAFCPPCVCDCSSDTILSSGLINSSLADCGKHDPELNEELKKDITDLLTEELSLQRIVTNDNMQHTKASIVEARKTSSHYQKEAEKCTAGMETCEEAREKAEAELRAERKLSAVWEERAREHGWKDLRKAYL